MMKYYTRACNFFFGQISKEKVNKKSSIPLNGNNLISFDTVELISRKNSKFVKIKDIKKLPEKLKKKIYKDLKTRETGSAALDLAYVAAGRFDGYFQKNLNLWDIAAGIILVNESGGKISNVDMSVIENIKITAASNSINEKMLEKLNNF